jgi:predicted AAA+ superfamily ATPase
MAESYTGETQLARIAEALERLSPPAPLAPEWSAADAFVWIARECRLNPVPNVARVPLTLLKGIDRQRDTLLANTRRFAHGLAANNALLWGARGMGKSALVKAVHAQIVSERPGALKLVEIHKRDLASLGALMAQAATSGVSVLLFCDDMSFTPEETDYRALKAVLEGGIEGRPANVILYATSNRRHLLPREMIENERSTAIHADEAVDEKVSLSDRFGLWLGFHACTQAVYLEIVEAYAKAFTVKLGQAELRQRALSWAIARGARSGRVAWQFIQDVAGEGR